MVTKEEMWGGGINQELEMNIHTLLYIRAITNKDLLYSSGNSARGYGAAWMGGEFGGEWMPAYVRLSLFAVHLKLTTLLTGYTPI